MSALLLLLALAALSCSEDLEGLPALGTLERDRLELVAEADEPVLENMVREGERVEAGALLVRQGGGRVAAQADRARGARDEARARLDELEHGPRLEQITEARRSSLGRRARPHRVAQARARRALAGPLRQRARGSTRRALRPRAPRGRGAPQRRWTGASERSPRRRARSGWAGSPRRSCATSAFGVRAALASSTPCSSEPGERPPLRPSRRGRYRCGSWHPSG
jgi:hypothetical protein